MPADGDDPPPPPGGVGQTTVTATGPTFPLPSLVVLTEAELGTCPHVAEVVGEVMWTCLLVPEAMVPKAQLSDWLPTEPVIVHPESEPPASMAQFSPVLVGRVSVTVTPVAVPVPPAVAVITNPIVLPAFTGLAPATWVMEMEGQFTVMEASRASPPAFVELTEAVLVTCPQVSAVVGEVMWTCLLVPEAMVPKLHVSTWLPTEPVIVHPEIG